MPGPWAAGERILVCVSEDPRAAGLVRYTKRLADRLHAPWTAISIETRRSLQLTDEQRDRLADTMRLAEALGGEALTIPGVGRRIADDVIGFAHANNVTQIIIGKSTRSWWFELMRGSVVHDLVRRAGNISVHVIAGDELPASRRQDGGADRGAAASRSMPRPYLMALLFVAVGLGAAELIQPLFGIENVDLVFLTAVVGVAVRYGLWPSLLASVAASLCYNFFFLPPVYTFTITDPTNVAAFFFFMLIAHPGVQRRGAGAHPGRHRDRPGADHRVALCLQPQAGGHRDAGRRAVGDRLSDRADAEGARGAAAAGGRRADASRRAIRRRTSSTRPISPPPTGPGAMTARPAAARTRCRAPSGCSCRCEPGAAPIGVIGIDDDRTGPLLTPDQRRLLDALVDQGALAIERVLLVEDMDRVKRTVGIRPAALGAVDLDLARSQDAAGLGARRRLAPCAISRAA